MLQRLMFLTRARLKMVQDLPLVSGSHLVTIQEPANVGSDDEPRFTLNFTGIRPVEVDAAVIPPDKFTRDVPTLEVPGPGLVPSSPILAFHLD